MFQEATASTSSRAAGKALSNYKATDERSLSGFHGSFTFSFYACRSPVSSKGSRTLYSQYILRTLKRRTTISCLLALVSHRVSPPFTMPTARRVTDSERRLGFRWHRGLSRTKGESCKIPLIKLLIEEIDKVKQRWVNVLPSVLRKTVQFEEQCLELYSRFAPRIWANPPADRNAWLVQSSENDWNGLYPHDLFVDELDHT